MFASDLLRCPTWCLPLMWPSWQPARRSGSRRADLAAHMQPRWLIKDSRHLLTPRAHAFCRSEQVLHGKTRQNAEVNLGAEVAPFCPFLSIIDRSIKLWALWMRTTPSRCRLSRYTPSTPHTALLWVMNWLLFTFRRGGGGQVGCSVSISETMEEGWRPPSWVSSARVLLQEPRLVVCFCRRGVTRQAWRVIIICSSSFQA